MWAYWPLLTLLWIAFWGTVGAVIGSARGRTVSGLLLGSGLSFIGVIVVALLPPTEEKQRERDRAQAAAVRSALVGGGLGSAAPITPEVRRSMLAEAVRRDPKLADATDPESLAKLHEMMATLEREHVLKAELLELRESEERAERGAAAAALRAQEEAQAALDKRARIDALPAWRRWIAHRRAEVLVGIAAVIIVSILLFGLFLAPSLKGTPATSMSPSGASPAASSLNPSAPNYVSWLTTGCPSATQIENATGRPSFEHVDTRSINGKLWCHYLDESGDWGRVLVSEAEDDYTDTSILSGKNVKVLHKRERADLGWRAVSVEYRVVSKSDRSRGCLIQVGLSNGNYLHVESTWPQNEKVDACVTAENVLYLTARPTR